tara:strand:- start:891 stop:2591 length:1701 start_codon:yes stop_codon:yes gene_type:complete
MNTSQIKVYEERNSIYTLGEELHFFIPQSVLMINPLETFLKFNIAVGSTTELDDTTGIASNENYLKLLLNDKIGAVSLIKELTITSGNGGVVLEQIDNYNRLSRLIDGYTDNHTMEEKKRIFEGADHVRAQEHNLLYNSTNTTDEAMTMKKIEVVIPLRLSGLFNNKQPFPSYLTGGLKVRILLEDDIYKVVRGASSGTGAEEAPVNKALQNTAVGYEENLGDFRVYDSTNLNGVTPELNIVNTYNEAIAGDAVNSNCVAIEGSNALSSSPFNVGQKIIISGLTPSTGDIDANGNCVAIIDELGYSNGRFEIEFKNAIDFSGNTSDNVHVRVATQNMEVSNGTNVFGSDVKPTVQLSDMEFIVGSVTPTPQQIKQLESKVMSGGYAFDFQTFRDFMINNNAGSTFISNSILCKFKRAKAILSAYEVLGKSKVYRDNLTSPVDNRVAPSSYQYIINNILTPNQKVGLSRYQRNRGQNGGWEQGHIMEFESALESLGYTVRNLTNIDGNLMIARALSKYGHTYNLAQNQGDLRLNIEFTTQNENLLYHNWVGYIKTVVINKSGIVVLS